MGEVCTLVLFIEQAFPLGIVTYLIPAVEFVVILHIDPSSSVESFHNHTHICMYTALEPPLKETPNI